MRRALRSSMLVLTAACAVVLAGCGGDPVDNSLASTGWPGAHADARNSNTSPGTGSRDVSFAWSRPLGGPVSTTPSIAPNGQISLTARTERGCNLFSFQSDSERKRWCTRLSDGATASTPVSDSVANIYIGDEGAMNSYNEYGQLRWRTPVSGTPLSAQFTADGNLLFVTHLGNIHVLDTQNGRPVLPAFQMIPPPNVDGTDGDLLPNDAGLDECFLGTAACPVAHTPAIDLASGRFFVTFFRPGSPATELVAIDYVEGDSPRIAPAWASDVLPGGAASSPVVSADGTRVYVNDREGRLWALDAETGAPQWNYALGYVAAAAPSVSDDGLLVVAGGEEGRLLAVRDAGDSAELAWERDDVLQLGVPAQSAGETGYTVIRDGDDGLALLTFDTGDGSTLDQTVLPDALGFSTGTAIGPKGEVVVPSFLGELFVLR